MPRDVECWSATAHQAAQPRPFSIKRELSINHGVRARQRIGSEPYHWTALQTDTLFRNGHSVEEIATQRNLVTKTVESHLIECISAGLTVDISKFGSDSDRTQIEKAIAEHGTDKLKPIRDSLPENITYNVIRFVVAQHRLAKTAK